MNVRDLPFKESDTYAIKVLRHDKDDLIFRFGDVYFTIKSPYDWRDRIGELDGETVNVTLERFGDRKEKARLVLALI
ncbi:MAG: hypothetical protein JW870_17880 [Candidatus Delongbacteria bacterium]|nr:hypothetical protein [Candidatus Delongbacteria bacterium]